jgi:uncharacterized protein YycO
MSPEPGDYFCVPMSGQFGKDIALGELILRQTAKRRYTFPAVDARRYQHCGILVDTDTIVEAEPGGAVRRELHYDPATILWSSFDLTDAQRSMICRAAVSQIGTPYSFIDYVAIARHAWGMDTRWLQDYIGTTDHMICSQLVDWCYAFAGAHLFTDERWPGFVIPPELAALALTA